MFQYKISISDKMDQFYWVLAEAADKPIEEILSLALEQHVEILLHLLGKVLKDNETETDAETEKETADDYSNLTND